MFESESISMLEVSDVTGQKRLELSDVPADATVGEVIEELLADLNLSPTDVEGRPLTYQARLDREGRHLHPSEKIGDATRSGDHLTLQPNIDAGGRGGDPGDRDGDSGGGGGHPYPRG